jgi:hypothetical protein
LIELSPLSDCLRKCRARHDAFLHSASSNAADLHLAIRYSVAATRVDELLAQRARLIAERHYSIRMS